MFHNSKCCHFYLFHKILQALADWDTCSSNYSIGTAAGRLRCFDKDWIHTGTRTKKNSDCNLFQKYQNASAFSKMNTSQ